MKKIALISAIALGSLVYSNVNAQVFQIGVQIGGGRPPVVQASVTTPVAVVAAPVAVNYANADYYYYMPEVDAYYSVYEKVYYYNTGSRWVSAAYLPGAYRNYTYNTVRYYEVRARRPYLNASLYRERYNARPYYNWDRREVRIDNRNDRRNDRFDVRTERRDDRFDNRNNGRNNQNNNLRFDKRNDQQRGREYQNNRDNRGGRSNDGPRGGVRFAANR